VAQIDMSCLLTQCKNCEEIILKSSAQIEIYPDNYRTSKRYSAAKMTCLVPKQINSITNYVMLSTSHSNVNWKPAQSL